MADLSKEDIVMQVAELSKKLTDDCNGFINHVAIGALCSAIVNINLSTSNTTEELHAAFKRDVELLTALFGANFELPPPNVEKV
jgi:hypothetical protein